MIKVRLLKSGEVREVPKNEAHRMIEAGEAMLAHVYQDRQLRAGRAKRYKIK